MVVIVVVVVDVVKVVVFVVDVVVITEGFQKVIKGKLSNLSFLH